jgi:outer membrane protein assembly factor BamE (lipoprotein component of BamABCDE complex)
MRKAKTINASLAAALLLACQVAAARDGVIGSEEELRRIQIGTTTSAQLTEIAGKPMRVERFPRKGVESWSYMMQAGGRPAEIAIELDDKGIVRNIERVVRWGP